MSYLAANTDVVGIQCHLLHAAVHPSLIITHIDTMDITIQRAIVGLALFRKYSFFFSSKNLTLSKSKYKSFCCRYLGS